MLKEHKKQLKKIYKIEYAKAIKEANVAEYNKQLSMIKKNAQAEAQKDAKSQISRHSKRLVKGTKKAVKLGVAVGKAASQARKKHGKKAKTISNNITRMNRELGF